MTTIPRETVVIAKRKEARKLKKRFLLKEIWRNKHWYLFLVPTFVGLFVFGYYPPLSALYHAFFRWDGANVERFIGLENFRYMFLEDWRFHASIPNILKLMGFRLVFNQLLVPILVAELIYSLKNSGWAYRYRLLLLIPMVVPGMVILYLWQFIFEPNYGLANALLGAIGLDAFRSTWFADPKMALFTYMLTGFPWVSGVSVLIYLAGLQNIPGSIVDAAQLDGAIGLRRVWMIDLPLIMGQIKLMIVLGVIQRLQNYGAQLILTNGGPGVATLVPGLHMYNAAFMHAKMGYASAIGLMLFMVILGLTLINMKFIRSGAEY